MVFLVIIKALIYHTGYLRIQAAWRGYVVRKWYKMFQKTNPPKDEFLRKRFFQEKVNLKMNKFMLIFERFFFFLVKCFNYDHDNLLNEIDKNLAKSRDIFNQLNIKLENINDEQWLKIKKIVSKIKIFYLNLF